MTSNDCQYIILTGCLGGIGKSIINATNQQSKFKIIGIDLKLATNKEKILNIEDYFSCDIEDPRNIYKTLDIIFKKYQKINHLINNAGIMNNDPILKLDWNYSSFKEHLELWNKTININLRACYALSMCFSNELYKKRDNGSITHISSISSNGNIGQSSYSSSKGGVRSLSKTLSKELAPFGIRSNVVIPGFINTDAGSKANSEKVLRKRIANTPVKRLGEPEEVAQSVLFAIENEFINGCEINVDGGLVL